MSGPGAEGAAEQASGFQEVRIILCLGDDENCGTGKLCCRELNLVVALSAGRAIIWINTAGNYHHWEPMANALSQSTSDANELLAGLTFRPSGARKPRHVMEPKQTAEGIPLVGTEDLPDGTWLPSMYQSKDAR